MERVILTRHAESVFNVRGVLNGDPSIPGGLTEEGRAQARRLGERLRDEQIDLCVTTEFERTQETADIALAGRNVPRAIVPDLNDPPAGDLEQRPYPVSSGPNATTSRRSSAGSDGSSNARSRPSSPSCTDTSSRGSRAAPVPP